MLSKELLKKIRYIELKTARLVDETTAGEYHSAFKGQGMTFEEVRPYQFGDDVRSIDWKVTARAGEPYIKLYREERELNVVLLVDFSASQDFGATGKLKRELVTELGAALAFSAIKNQDRISMIGFTDQIEKHIPAGKGTRHVLRVIRELLLTEPVGHETNIAMALDHLNRVQSRRSIVFLISDFQDIGYEPALKIASRKHDLIPVVIKDQRETQLPDVGLLELVDNETGQVVVIDTSRKSHRLMYEKNTAEEKERRDQLFKRLNLDVMHVSTDRDFIEPLHRLFHNRQVRQWR